MLKRVATTLCVACGLTLGCKEAVVRNDQGSTDRELERQYAAWASRQPRPPQQVVNRVETLLAKEPCVGALNRWSRTYTYDEDMPNRTLYPGIVAFHLKAAGAFGVEPGLHVTEPNSWVTIDDTPIKMVWGDYEVSKDRLTVGFCGPNVGPTMDDTGINRRDYDDDLKRRRGEQREKVSTQIEP
jgi:hypothetical protein